MQNTTMQDALTKILNGPGGVSRQLADQTDDAVLSAVRATRRKLRKTTSKSKRAPVPEEKKKTETAVFAPRYVDPRRKNPFSVHAYSVLRVPEAEEEKASEPVSAVLTSETSESEMAAAGKDLHLSSNVKIPVVEESTPISNLPPESTASASLPSIPSLPAKENSISEPLAKPESPAPDTTPEEEEALPAAVLPSNLQWLKKPTPFSSNLTAIVDELRDARQRVIFTLQQHQARQKEFRKQLDVAEFGIAEQEENLRQLDDTISACALVAEQSNGLNPVLLVANPVHHHRHVERKMGTPFASIGMRKRDPAICHPNDLIQFFKANSGVNWSVSEVYKALSASKKEHTEKQQIYAILSALSKSGRIQRVGNGIYRMDKTVDSEQGAVDSEQEAE